MTGKDRSELANQVYRTTGKPDPGDPDGGIRALGARHRARVLGHLVQLDAHDRYLRFGYSATDEHIRRYVEGLDFDRDAVFGIHNKQLELVAVAHLAHAIDKDCMSCAEFGVSVLKSERGRGYGKKLFDRAMMHARNVGVEQFFIHALSENMAMLSIARKAGAKVLQDGPESRAYLRLPPASFDSMVTELIEEKMAQIEYGLKKQARKFWSLLLRRQSRRQRPEKQDR